MRKEKNLIKLLSGLVKIITEEANRNPDFAEKMETLLLKLPDNERKTTKKLTEPPPENLPDIHVEWNSRNEIDFRLWLREQPIPVLRAIIRIHDFDSTRRTIKWKEAEKLSEFIADGLRDRLSRGVAFIGRNETNEEPPSGSD